MHSDMLTLLPLLRRLKEKTGKTPERLIADSGYESEENYTGLEEMESEAYIKPSNYERSKTRKYKADRFKADNMPYDEQSDSFACPGGKQLVFQGIKHSESKSGFVSEISYYACSACGECPLRKQCTKSQKGRTIQRAKAFWAYRAQSQERMTSEYGTRLRLNRSIQSEGTFSVLKQDWGFRRFLRRGSIYTFTDILLYAFAFNIAKLNTKIQSQKSGVILHQLTTS